MKTGLGLGALLLFGFSAAALAQNQATSSQNTTARQQTGQPAKAKYKRRGAGGDIGSGTADIGKGAAKGAGNLASGVGRGAVDLVTLHPVDAAVSVGKGGVSAGKNIAVGATKGTGKVAKGVGKGIRHIF